MKRISVIAPSRSGHNWTVAMIKSWLDGQEYVVNRYENVPPERFQREFNRVTRKQDPGDVLPPVIQIRDFLNWFASFVRFRTNHGVKINLEVTDDWVRVWLKIAMEFFHETSYLAEKITLRYEDFVKYPEVREIICERIGGSYNEEKINFVPSGGEGSSFDGDSYQGSGSQMDVGRRYMFFLTDEGKEYLPLLKRNMEAIEFYKRHFTLNEQQKYIIFKLNNNTKN